MEGEGVKFAATGAQEASGAGRVYREPDMERDTLPRLYDWFMSSLR